MDNLHKTNINARNFMKDKMQCLTWRLLGEIQIGTACGKVPFRLSKAQTFDLCSSCYRARPLSSTAGERTRYEPYRHLAMFSKIAYAPKLRPTIYLGIHSTRFQRKQKTTHNAETSVVANSGKKLQVLIGVGLTLFVKQRVTV